MSLPVGRLTRSGLNMDARSRFGCGQSNGRCFWDWFGGEDRDYYGATQGRPPFFVPPTGPYSSNSMDYYEVCDEVYDPYNDEYFEDCTIIPDYD